MMTTLSHDSAVSRSALKSKGEVDSHSVFVVGSATVFEAPAAAASVFTSQRTR